MNEFVNRIDNLLSQKNLKRNNLYEAIEEINAHSFYDWSRRGTVPSADIAYKIASFLGTSVEYLITGNEELPSETKNRILEKKLEDIRNIIDS